MDPSSPSPLNLPDFDDSPFNLTSASPYQYVMALVAIASATVQREPVGVFRGPPRSCRFCFLFSFFFFSSSSNCTSR